MAEQPESSSLTYQQMLLEAVKRASGAEARHVESVPTKEVFQGKTVWDGTVEVFDLAGHPKAKRAFAWGHAMRDTGNEVRIVTVLGVPPVDSPRKAVQVSVLNDLKNR